MNRTLAELPVELLYEIHLFALAPSFPHTCKRIHLVFKNTPSSYRAQYLIACIKDAHTRDYAIPTKLLRYPLCTKEVLEAFHRIAGNTGHTNWATELPRRFFRSLTPKVYKDGSPVWSERDYPLPFLRYLYECPKLNPPPDANSHDGYPLTKAVHAGFVPLIRFLLDHGASPQFKNNLPVLVAIHRKDLALVRLLIERTESDLPAGETKRKGKKRKLEDRVSVTPEMLKTAVKSGARDIVEYFTREKGCVPDMQTLLMLS
ncbi:hypothetical protein BV22DRAFT_1192961 [Leucogyrophana mollusca]|uniref:Uncharacterized protein n=1 Tax=Leucogyrophana mollusca TaxID=85980 RepID=A0ACB8BQQ0_9AGAM|nr:hypothetical protein BV22DRAFT_1192961 [Leucogyrophana mollusca]